MREGKENSSECSPKQIKKVVEKVDQACQVDRVAPELCDASTTTEFEHNTNDENNNELIFKNDYLEDGDSMISEELYPHGHELSNPDKCIHWCQKDNFHENLRHLFLPKTIFLRRENFDYHLT